MSEVEYAVPLTEQLRGMSDDERAQVLAELRCVRCRKRDVKVTPEARVCTGCVVEIRAAS
jgi:hypothetical protein